MKIIIALFSLLLISHFSLSQLKLKKDNRSCLYGLVDSSGVWIVPATYSNMKKTYYIKGYFIVEDIIESGVLNDKGEIVVPVIYDKISEHYTSPYFFIEKNDQHGLIKTDGTILVEPIYSFINCFKDLICYRQDGKYGLMSTNELVDIITPQNYEIDDLVGSKGSNYSIRRPDPNKKYQYLYGILSQTGEILLPPDYSTQFRFIRSEIDNNRLNKKYGIVNSLGEIIIPFEYDFIDKPYDQNHYVLRKQNRLSLASSETGEILTKQAYDSIGDFNYNNIARVVLDHKYGLINKKGEEIIPVKYKSMEEFHSYSSLNMISAKYSICEEDGKFGILNDQGETAVPFDNDWLGWPDPLTRKDVFFMKEDSLRLLNIKTLKVSSPSAYFKNDESVRKFEINGKFGMISRTGYIEADFIFENIEKIQNGKWYGYRNGEGISIITSRGNYVSQSKYYDEIRPMITDHKNGNSYYPVVLNGKYGAVSEKGATAISADNDDLLLPPEIYPTGGGKKETISWTYNADKGQWRINSAIYRGYTKLYYDYPIKLNLHGYNLLSRELLVGICDSALNVIVPFEYESIIQHNDSIFWMSKKMKWGLYNINKPKTPVFKYNKLIMLNGSAMLTNDKYKGEDIYDKSGKLITSNNSLKDIFKPKESRIINFTTSHRYHPYSKLKYAYYEADHQFFALIEEQDSADVKVNNYILNQLFRKSYIPFYQLQGHPIYQHIKFVGYRGGTEARCFDLKDHFSNGTSILLAAKTKWERYHKIKRKYAKRSWSRKYRFYYRKSPKWEVCDIPNKPTYRLEYFPLGKTSTTATILKSDDKNRIYNYRIDGEKFESIDLSNLFIEGFEASLSAMCFDELDKFASFEMDCMRQDALVTSKTDKFILRKDSICIFFLNTSRRSWDQPITLPYTQLKELFKQEAWIEKMTGKLD